MKHDDLSPEIRDFMRFMLEEVTADANEAPAETPTEEAVDYWASPERQELYRQAKEYVAQKGMVCTEDLEEHFTIGYALAALLIDRMQDEGILPAKKCY